MAIGRVTSRDRDDPPRAIDDAVGAIFARDPFTAGCNTPAPRR